MLLAIDIGNTNTVLGIFKDEKLLLSRRLVSSHSKTVDEYWVTVKLLCEDANINPADLKATIIGSVVPILTQNFAGMARKYLSMTPLIVDHKLNLNLNLKVTKPETLGADRICNMVAAKKMYGYPIIVIDFGTATTFEVLDTNGDYMGGAISPGLEAGLNELIKKAAQLHTVDMKFPKNIIGDTTKEQLQSGIFGGHVYMVQGILKKIEHELGGDKIQTLVTGGLSKEFAEILNLTPEENLTLYGLKILYNMNK
ncbi:MAG: type III pantothenate kinase [Candidatus Marinimicrobia bacterium]|nr:type III pantothenate kinase [Candidatus Neomarinimicrobiota bacterium]